MKVKYNLVTIKFKIAKSKETVGLHDYSILIKSFRCLQDLGILEVQYFDSKENDMEIGD